MSSDTIPADSGLLTTEVTLPQDRVENRLKLIFAIQSCLGGLVLSSGEETELIAVVAIFFAVFGYVFVDLLRLFALPPVAAYAAMTLVALYSVSQFSDLSSPGQQQMIAVGGLLVNVQSILMLQEKSRRIFEQLIIFSLLELIVAAVFNNAIYYAFVMVPMLLLSVASLSLMSSLRTWDGIEPSSLSSDKSVVRIWSPSSTLSFHSSVMRFPRLALAIFGPAIIAVGLIFFYALPRIGNAKRLGSSGLNSVGFSDQFQLGQIGRMLQNSELAMRVTLNRANSNRAYLVDDSIYLRGLVLEIYEPTEQLEGQTSRWESITAESSLGVKAVPPRYLSPDPADDERFDLVDVRVMAEPMSSKSLFMIAPYHRTGPSAGLVHSISSWTSYRSDSESSPFPRMDYTFGSVAFSRGNQTRLITPLSHPTESLIQRYEQDTLDVEFQESNQRKIIEERKTLYRQMTLAFDEDIHPTAASMAERIAGEVPANERSPFGIAMALENYFQQSSEFSYTLNLNAEPIPGIDSIEQFLSVDKKGHCQYFASALVMMLRSKDIPARIVAGYNTDEFNELGGYYMVRQLHAHAWVEALVPRASIPKSFLNSEGYVPGQLPADEYWLRLDPTPAAGREIREPTSGMDQVMDLAKNMWDEYVVDMDGNRQDSSIVGGNNKTSMSDSYSSFIRRIQLQISRIRNGEFGGGAWAGRDVFSIPAALLGIGMVLACLAMFRLRLPSWLRSRIFRKGSNVVAEPSIPFYAEALRQLGRLGIYREAGQTPAEFATDQTLNPQYAMFTEPLSTLTAAFYRYRFGQDEALNTSHPLEPQVESALSDIREKVDLIRGKKA